MSALNKFKNYIGWGEEVDEYADPYRGDSSVAFSPSVRASSHVDEAKYSAIHSMTTIHPRSFSDARTIGEAFRDGLTTVVNLEQLSVEEGRRIVDFFSGLAFALQGQVSQVSAKTFIISPAEIDVVTDGSASGFQSTDFYNHG
jgi:cell division inhibitor SepF